MNRKFWAGSISFLALLGTPLQSGNAAQDPTPISADTLPLEDLNLALEAIWNHPTPDPSPDPLASRRVALENALLRLGPGSAILPAPTSSAPNDPLASFFQELLPAKIAYIRLGKIVPERATELEAALRDFHQLGARALILDLRASHSAGSLNLAAELASYFVPKNTPLFSIQQLTGTKTEAILSRKNPAPTFPLLLLVSSNTSGCAEVLAAALRFHADAFVLGQQTAGAAADYAEIPLSEGRTFRFPVTKAVFEKAPALFPKGLPPDLPLAISAELTEAVLQKAAIDGKVAPLISETGRPRFNEAALVAGKNPETESWIRQQLARTQGIVSPKQPPRDTTLQRALDFIEARAILQPHSESVK